MSATGHRAEADEMLSAATHYFRDHWGLYLAEGLLLIFLGAAAILLPLIATLAVTILLGWLLIFSGVAGLISSFWLRRAPGFWWSLLSAVLAIATGFLLLGWLPGGLIVITSSAGNVLIQWPAGGVVAVTLVLIVFFTIDGVASIMYAIHHRRESTRQWGLILGSGIISLLLAGIILAGLPGTAAWVLGLLVGIDMVFSGTALAIVALVARSAAADRGA